ncbi:hypothetical protein CRUP_010055, partial [Coryphaenoides rupestris]
RRWDSSPNSSPKRGAMSRYLKHFTAVGDDKPSTGTWEELDETSEEPAATADQPPPKLSVVVVCLVILDAIFVLAEVLIDLSIIKLEHDHIAPQVFHYLSLALLTFFMMELAGKLFAYQLEFFQHKFEVFDGLVIVVSFVLDIVYIFNEDSFDGMGFLILLRLWRVARILNGILVSLKTRADYRLHQLKETYDHLVQRATELQERNDKLEQENNRLGTLLKQNGIEF